MPSDTRHTPAAKPTTTRAEVHVHHDDLLRHIGSGLSTPGGCCDVKEPDLSVALDVGGTLAQRSVGHKWVGRTRRCVMHRRHCIQSYPVAPCPCSPLVTAPTGLDF